MLSPFQYISSFFAYLSTFSDGASLLYTSVAPAVPAEVHNEEHLRALLEYTLYGHPLGVEPNVLEPENVFIPAGYACVAFADSFVSSDGVRCSSAVCSPLSCIKLVESLSFFSSVADDLLPVRVGTIDGTPTQKSTGSSLSC